MNKEGNARSEATKQKINRALMYLLTHKSFNEIYVKDVCTIACINRSSFYEHYQDINDLMIKTEKSLSKQIEEIFENVPYFNNDCYVKMFRFIKENKEFYSAYVNNNDGSLMAETDFKKFYTKMKNSTARADFKENELIYHMAFFSAGLLAICKTWIANDFKETPEEMAEIVHKEYSKKAKFF